MHKSDRGPGQQILRIARACWVEQTHGDDLRTVCAAALASSPDDTIIASVTAGRLRQVWLPPDDLRIHVATATPGSAARLMTRTRRPEFVAHRFQLDPGDIEMVDGIAVTSLARTWRDLAAVLPVPDLVAAGDSILRAGCTIEELLAQIDRMGTSRGAQRARTALPLLDADSESRGESHMRVAISVPELPRFRVNKAISRDDGGWLATPDLSLEEAKLALEYQGSDHAELRRMRRDLTRGVDVRSNRWRVLLYGPAEAFGRPWEIRAEVVRELRERAPHLLRPRRSRRVIA